MELPESETLVKIVFRRPKQAPVSESSYPDLYEGRVAESSHFFQGNSSVTWSPHVGISSSEHILDGTSLPQLRRKSVVSCLKVVLFQRPQIGLHSRLRRAGREIGLLLENGGDYARYEQQRQESRPAYEPVVLHMRFLIDTGMTGSRYILGFIIVLAVCRWSANGLLMGSGACISPEKTCIYQLRESFRIVEVSSTNYGFRLNAPMFDLMCLHRSMAWDRLYRQRRLLMRLADDVLLL